MAWSLVLSYLGFWGRLGLDVLADGKVLNGKRPSKCL